MRETKRETRERARESERERDRETGRGNTLNMQGYNINCLVPCSTKQKPNLPPMLMAVGKGFVKQVRKTNNILAGNFPFPPTGSYS